MAWQVVGAKISNMNISHNQIESWDGSFRSDQDPQQELERELKTSKHDQIRLGLLMDKATA